MKKALFLLSFLLFSACQAVEQEIEEGKFTSYSNAYYGFTLSFPESLTYCLNSFCYNEIPEDVIANFTLKDPSGEILLEIQPYKNLLNMTAAKFGARSLAMNREYGENFKDIYSEEENTDFASQPAFTFIAEEVFEERGGSQTTDENGYIAIMDDPETYETPALSFSLNRPYRVIYVDYGEHFFRILHSLDEETELIMESFIFLNKDY